LRKKNNTITEESRIVDKRSETHLSNKIVLQIDEEKLAELNVFKDPINSIII